MRFLYTALLLIEIYVPVKFQSFKLIPLKFLCYLYALDRIFVNILKPLGQLKPNFIWHQHGIEEKMESLFKWFRSFFVIHYCQTPGAGAFSKDFTTNLAPQCRAFSRALKSEKLKAPLFWGSRGPGIQMMGVHHKLLLNRFEACPGESVDIGTGGLGTTLYSCLFGP